MLRRRAAATFGAAIIITAGSCLAPAEDAVQQGEVRVYSSSFRAALPVAGAYSSPNVVVVMVDDMRADEMRYMPRTRRLIGDRGVTFRNSFSPFPLCCPARASVLTGLYAHNHRVYGTKPPWGFSSFDDSQTVATWLRRSGYATVYIGKYLNGYGERPRPGARSGRSLHYVPSGWTDWHASIDGGLPKDDPRAGTTYRYFDTTLSHDGHGFVNFRGQYQSRVYGRLSERMIRRRAQSDRPFLFFVSYTAPHVGGPREPDDPNWVAGGAGTLLRFNSPARPDDVKGMFRRVIHAAPGASWFDAFPDDKPRYLRSRPPISEAVRRALRLLAIQRAQALHVVDVQVQRTIRALRDSGELRRTLVLFTSDNGFFLGEQRVPWGKVLPHEPSIRVPMLMRGPTLPAGVVRFDPITSVDLAPTIARFAAIKPYGHVDGTSMLRVARQGDRGWSRAVLTDTGPMLATRSVYEARASTDPGDPRHRRFQWGLGIRTRRYLYVSLASGEEELYDLVDDPRQYRNRARDAKYTPTLDLLRAELHRMRGCEGRACSAPMSPELVTGPNSSTRENFLVLNGRTTGGDANACAYRSSAVRGRGHHRCVVRPPS